MATEVNYASSSLGDDELERRFEEALTALRATTSPVEPQLIGAHEIREGPIVERFDPCAPHARVAAAHEATSDHIAAAVAAARAQTKSWRNTPYAERIARLPANEQKAALTGEAFAARAEPFPHAATSSP